MEGATRKKDLKNLLSSKVEDKIYTPIIKTCALLEDEIMMYTLARGCLDISNEGARRSVFRSEENRDSELIEFDTSRSRNIEKGPGNVKRRVLLVVTRQPNHGRRVSCCLRGAGIR